MANSRSRYREPSSFEPKTLLIGAVVLATGYVLLSWGPAYWEYVRIRGVLKSTAEDCIMTSFTDGPGRTRCTTQARREVAAILSRDDPDLSMDLNEQNGRLLLMCEYSRTVQPPGLSPRVLRFSYTATAEPTYRGFNIKPP